jgi:hypothetical protein
VWRLTGLGGDIGAGAVARGGDGVCPEAVARSGAEEAAGDGGFDWGWAEGKGCSDISFLQA